MAGVGADDSRLNRIPRRELALLDVRLSCRALCGHMNQHNAAPQSRCRSFLHNASPMRSDVEQGIGPRERGSHRPCELFHS